MVKFIVHPDFHHPSHPDFRRATWASWLLFTIIIFVILYSIYFFIFQSANQVKQTLNLIGLSFMIVSAIQMRVQNNLNLVLLQLSILGVFPTMVSVYNTGGIYSMDIVWLFLNIFCAFIVSTLVSGLTVTLTAIMYVAYLYYEDYFALNTGFKNYIVSHDSTHNVITIIFVFVLTSTVLVLFVKSLESANKTIEKLKEQQINDLELKLKYTTDEISLLRSEIAKDFHDEMGNKLASITLLAQSIGIKLRNNDNPEIKEMLASIEKRSHELYHGTKDFIWAIDFKSDYIYEIFLYLREFGEVFFNELDIDFKSDANFDSSNISRLETNSSKHLIYIIKEVFTNAAKHSKCKQVSFSIELSEDGRFIAIEILDNGNGFDTSLPSSRGLSNIEKRASRISGKLVLKSSEAGTRYTLKLPIK